MTADDSGSVTSQQQYDYGSTINELLLMRKHDGSQYGVTRNQQWSIMALYDFNSGTIQKRFNYSVFGQRYVLDSDGSYSTDQTADLGLRHGYTTREHAPETSLMYFRARYYDPSTGDFISKDPLEYVDGMSMYRGYFVLGNVDPTGRCKAELVCANLLPGVEHCGIEVTDSAGKRYYHVVSPNAGILGKDTCDVQDTGPTRIDTPIGVGPWRVVETWSDPTGNLCICVDSIAALIRGKKLPYWPNPYNEVYWNESDRFCKTRSFCNSNYTTHCIMKKCGIDSKRDTGRSAPGWDHRMQECAQFTKYAGLFCDTYCECSNWRNIDNDWCADAPVAATIQPDQK